MQKNDDQAYRTQTGDTDSRLSILHDHVATNFNYHFFNLIFGRTAQIHLLLYKNTIGIKKQGTSYLL